MSHILNLKKFSFLVYGLGSTGSSVVRFFKKKKIKNFSIWDDNLKLRKQYKSKKVSNLNNVLKKVDYIVLSPGVSLHKTKFKRQLKKYNKKIITDIDLLYLSNSYFKSIVVTGTNGKSTTCKIIQHLLKNNKFQTQLGGNIGTPVLDLNIQKNIYLIIEASSFQLSHSKFISPDYAILLNITNDHLDWHGSLKNYISSKLKIFSLQNKENFAILNKKFKKAFKDKKYLSKLISIKFKEYHKIKFKLKNLYLKSKTNDENMIFAYTLAKLLKIDNESFIKSMNSFIGLPHRYEIFFRKKNIIFINDSKATSFESSISALAGSKNIFWILGGLPKYKDKLNLSNVKDNVIKSYIIGNNTSFFEKQLKGKIKFLISKNLGNAIKSAIKDTRLLQNSHGTILLSPGAASFDQFDNFETRGNEFKKLSIKYAKKLI